MALSDVELRVLGALVEKDRTTPESYPLSAQALLTACNQRTSRDPVTDYHLQDVMAAVNRLKDRGLAETIQELGDRVPKHRHKLPNALDLDSREAAVLAVLLLRGEQTPGELRSRTERYGGFPDVAAVEATLERLEERSAALVLNLGRSAGQSQDRWVHMLGSDERKMVPRARQSRLEGRPAAVAGAAGQGERFTLGQPVGGTVAERTAPPAVSPAGHEPAESYTELVRRIEALEQRVRLLETRV